MNNKIKNIVTKSAEETEKLGEEFAHQLQGGDIVCLMGDLGSGKTTFIKGVAIGLGIKSRIISPTFVLIRKHKIKLKSQSSNLKAKYKNSKLRTLYHIDLYRLEEKRDIVSLGLEELFNDKNSVIVIEWAEKLGNLLSKKRWDIKFKIIDENKREIRIEKIDNKEKVKYKYNNYMDNEIKKAIGVLNSGGIVIFPTDTAFGIGCRIDREDAIKRLFEIRKRPENQPVPVLVDSINMIRDYVQSIDEDVEEKLMKKYWPGGLTIILPANTDRVPVLVRGGGETIGVRMPNHKIALEMIKEVGVPILGPSANFHGDPTPFKFSDINKSLIKKVDYVLSGECTIKRESTVIDCTVKPWRILREGAVNINIKNQISKIKNTN